MATDNERSSQKINEKYCYVLQLYGSLINGQKVIVTLLGIQVFFDVLVPDGETPDECEMKVRDILSGEVETQKIEHIKAFPFRDYHTEKKTYLRIYMSGTSKRKTAIKAVQDNNYETASDDLYSFHHLTMITDRFPISALRRDHTVVFTWDIETQSQELDDPKPLKQICLVDIETEPDPRWTTIVCGNQENLLKAFALCWRAFAPDIQVGFNDSDYDWHFIMERAYHLNILEWIWERMTGKFEMKEEILNFLKLPGCVPIDVRVCLKKRYPHSEVEKEGSLKFFLQKCGLDAKANMSYDKM
ncbi:ribonuclease H-like domain-containing protein [Glomus cerebriforme]|uniref:Ribonuclease H-like domain-containing protein n=1 Tax=Glomus cerebriforme TaxID=658196 RepID=A0A397S985_9GLOM|nr:ribonuclease H-like domain-containing protein [Glomus cerebriforme]